MFKLLVGFAIIAMAYALPASNSVLDKVSADDVAANDVSPSVTKLDQIANVHFADDKSPSSTPPVVLSSPPHLESDAESSPTPFQPQQASSMFARLIDDIFQIPITVLQSVAKLITNPFKQQAHATPEATSTY
ncbi:PREDICTED: uncharacterized protein LOC108562163 [Nicrophorus vespilloides]|uniref:Uncharacterized protein LOC108562163 n=1 Tax=Nicrophorus vespilloides TaxID=110193 RepID=A0ABM1MMT0_NICVS|nr:PREDICTED: uncharacterized protein LOC108562163 [Nicrophorus vespilloides]